jgi:formate dehydrogenase maturation protein FdhE
MDKVGDIKVEAQVKKNEPLVCPVCGSKMVERHCKKLCTQGGYFVGCSE